jgi:hypothetical protein
MATDSSSPSDSLDLACSEVAFVHLFEGVGGDRFAIEFTLTSGEVVRLGFASERADELVAAILRSQAKCSARRGRHH